MKKKLIATISALTLSAFTQAEPSQFYLGIDTFLGGSKQSIEDDSGSNTGMDGTESADTGGGALTVGYRFADNDRFEVEFTKIESEFDNNRDEEFEGIDFSWSFAVLKQENFQPYAEAGFGLYTYNDTSSVSGDNKDLGGLAVNLGFGAIYELNEKVELDASYRIKGIGWEELETESGDSAKAKDDIGKFVFGARFLF